MNWDEWRHAGSPMATLDAGGAIMPVNVRASMNGQHPTVVDLLRPGPAGALVVCLTCGHSWPEGADQLPECTNG